MTKLQFPKSVFRHICQLSSDKGILFYSTADILVFYSMVSVKCLKDGIRPIGFSVMMNHYHFEAPFSSDAHMASFMNGVTSPYAKAYNSHYGLSGNVFHRPFNRSVKYGEKNIKDIFIYIGNNGKEKIPSIKAESYRWNFLMYIVSEHPFSEPIDYRKASRNLLNLLSIVMNKRSKLQPLGYDLFEGASYRELNDREKNQLTDFIINVYFFLDKEKIMSMYGDFEHLCLAMNSVTGKEHEFRDDSSREDYRHYYRMISICKAHGFDVTKYRFIVPAKYDMRDNAILPLSLMESLRDKAVLPSSLKTISPTTFSELIQAFRAEMNVSDYEIAKFFHLLQKE